MKFWQMNRSQIAQIDRHHTVVVAPLGSCEQHGTHLPVFTDTYLVTAIAERAEKERPKRLLLLPTFWLGASEHHLPFGATITPGPIRYAELLADMYDPILRGGFRRFLFLNGHGGNIEPMRVALRELKRRHPRCLLAAAAYWELARDQIAALCRGPRKEIGHGGEIETSMMLALYPQLVKPGAADSPSKQDVPNVYLAQTLAELSDQGAVGYPSLADAQTGHKLLQAIVNAVVHTVDRLAAEPLPEQLWSAAALQRP